MVKVTTLRFGAAVCAALAVLMFCIGLLGGSFSDQELVVTRKYVSGAQFRIYSESVRPGFAYDTMVSGAFYDVAQPGDRIRSPLCGYLRLVRDGRTIRRYFSDDFIFPAAYALAALFPSVVFIKSESLPLPKLILPIVAVLEGAILAMFLIGLFVPL
jgi:hypothetical protein